MNQDQNRPASARVSWRGILVLAVAGLLVAGLVTPHLMTFIQRPRFIRQWTERFRGIETLDAANRMAENEPVYVRVLPSGEWFIATCEHSCCTGAGFDATVIRDSAGAIYTDTTHTFCGVEGMSDAFSERQAPVGSLAAFYAGLSQLRLQRQ